MKILRIILCFTVLVFYSGCIGLNSTGDKVMDEDNKLNVGIQDVFKVEDWQTIGNWRDALGECDQYEGLNSNVATEIYRLKEGGTLYITVSYASGGVVYPYIVLDDILIIFFQDEIFVKNIMENLGCSKCIYANDITNSIFVDN